MNAIWYSLILIASYMTNTIHAQ